MYININMLQMCLLSMCDKLLLKPNLFQCRNSINIPYSPEENTVMIYGKILFR